MYCKIIQEIYLKNKEESCNSSRNDEISKGFINVRDSVNRTILISFLYVFPLYVFSMYFNLTFYTSFNYFYWNFSSNFLIDFPQYEWLFFFFMWGGKIRKHVFDNRLTAPGPATWMAFLSLYKGRNPKTRFRQISPNLAI